MESIIANTQIFEYTLRMKRFLIVLSVILIFQVQGFAQDSTNEIVYSSAGIEKQPEFPGGFKEFGNYVQLHYKYPNVRFLKGRVFIEFVVEKDGSIGDIRILKDIGYGTGDEAIRLMKNCPNWSPGIQDGKAVRVRYTLPIAINLK